MKNDFVYQIREFEEKDKPQILELFIKFGEFFKNLDPQMRCIVAKNYAEHYFKEMLKNTKKNGKVFVAEAKSKKIIGFSAGNFKVEKSPEIKQTKVARVHELFVLDSFRGKGIGFALLSKIESFFKENKCDLIRLEVFAPNFSARKFYEILGFQERNIDLIKMLK